MGRIVVLVLAALMVVVGLLWTFQGLGYIKGSSMTGEETWAVIGPASRVRRGPGDRRRPPPLTSEQHNPCCRAC